VTRWLAFLIPATILAAGCSSTVNPENQAVVPHPVSGKVVYDGKAAAGVVVTLIPIDAPMVPRIPSNPTGTTMDDGTFRITTFNDGDGAAEGGYLVVLNWPGATDENAEGEAKEDTDRLKGWYDIKHSNFNIRINPGDNALPTFTLPKVTQPPPAVLGVPGRN
jgi:hypothetical protein